MKVKKLIFLIFSLFLFISCNLENNKEYILAKEIEMKFKESEKRKKEEEKREKNIVLEKEKQENIKEFEGLLEEIKKRER